MRLLFITTSLVQGGAERHAITLMNRLAARGHDCHAVYVKNDATQRGRIRIGGRIETLDAQRFLDPQAVARMAATVAALRPDAMLAANPYALMYAQLGRLRARWPAPLAVVYHSTRVLGFKEHVKHALDRLFIRRADTLVFVSRAQARYWRARGLRAPRIEVIPNGIDLAHFRPAPAIDGAAMRTALGIGEGHFVIGLVAMLRPEKNPVQLVHAVAALRQQGIPAHALMIGDGPLRAAVEQAAAEHGITASVHITGLQEDVRPYLAACDVAALCSFTEALSLAALEAMAMARPVVHPEVGGGPDMILPGFNGDLYPVGDTAAFTTCLARLADRTRAARLGRNARRVVAAKFSEDAMVARYDALLQGMAARRAAAAPPPLPGAASLSADS